MRQLVLHVGQAKTGSTTIQMTLAAHARILARRGILFPVTRRMIRNHHRLMPAILDPDHLRKKGTKALEEKRRAATGEWKRVQALVEATRPDRIVMSSEALFQPIRPAEGARLRAMIDSVAEEVRVLAYLRSPAAHYLSGVQQTLKSRRHIAPVSARPLLGLIEAYRNNLGVKPEPRAFERAALLDGDVVADFAAWAELGPLPRRARVGDHNLSLSAEAMAVLHRFGAEGRPRTRAETQRMRRLRAAVRRADRRLPGATRPRLHPDIAERITRLATDLLPLRDRYGIVFADVDYALAGKADGVEPLEVACVETLCPLDHGRRDALAEAVRRALLPFWRRLLP